MASAANSAAGFEGSAGAGGKFRKRPFRRAHTTPYDRPQTALRPTQAAKTSWFSKLVDPASKLITAGAHKLFSSVFRKRLFPPPPPQRPPDEDRDTRDMKPEVASVVLPSGTKEPVAGGCEDPSRISESNAVAELEDLLKQKTFTRSEIDHLTTLLLARTADNSVGSEKVKSEPKFLDSHAVHGRHGELLNLRGHEEEIEGTLPGAMSTATTAKVEDNVASPAQLAEAYMSSRPTRVSPLSLGLQNQTPKQDLSGPYNLPFKLRSPAISLDQKPVGGIITSQNGLLTPKLRGRSAIYNMARTPYSRVHPTAGFKAADTAFDARGGSSSSHNDAKNNQFDGCKKQILKRRSSVLENDIGSVGPIRRIRQKPNLVHPKTLSLPASGGLHARHGSRLLPDVAEVHSSMDLSSQSQSFSKSLEDNSIQGTSTGHVPSQSVEMAQKIFEQLDKINSKGKSPEMKLDTAGKKSPTKMTPAMLHGLARRSMETVNSLNVLENVQARGKENVSAISMMFDVQDHLPKVPIVEEEANRKKFVVNSDSLASQKGTEATIPILSSSPYTEAIDDEVSESVVDHSQKRRAFQMSAHEDYLELDDDLHSNGVASTPMSDEGKVAESSEKSAAFPDSPSKNGAIAAEKPSVPEQKLSANLLPDEKESEFLSDGSAVTSSSAGFTFPILPSSSPMTSISVQAAAGAPLSTSGLDKVTQQNEINKSVAALSSKPDKLPSVSANPEDTKLELPSGADDAAASPSGPDKTNNKSTHSVVDVSGKLEDALSSVINSPKGIFSFGLPANSATLSNGLLSSVPAVSVTSSPFSLTSSSSNQTSVPVIFSSSSPPPFSSGSSLSNGFAGSMSTSVGAASAAANMIETTTSSSNLSSSVTPPSVSSGPTFQFGSSIVSKSATVATASESAKNPGAKSSESAFSSSAGSLFSFKSSATASDKDGFSGFNASTPKTSSSEVQTAAPTASSGPIFGFQASSSSSSSQSFPSQMASSSSSPVFGSSFTTNSTSGASIFSSLPSAANPFSSGSTSAPSSSGSSSMTSSVSSSSSPASSIFGSSWQSSKATMGTTFGTPSPSTGFSFGIASSRSLTSSNNTSMVFGSTSSSSASNSAPFVFGSTGTSVTPTFSFSSAVFTPTAFAPSQPTFGMSTPAFAFGSTPSGNNDQMNMEDSMAEDAAVQSLTPAAPVFNQSPVSAPSAGFMFGAAAPSTGSSFQFGSQQNQMALQGSSPFQPSGSLEFNAGGAGSFSLGSVGGDKANRRIVKVKGKLRRK